MLEDTNSLDGAKISDTLKLVKGGDLNGPVILPASNSFAIFCLIISGSLFADSKFIWQNILLRPFKFNVKPLFKIIL